MAFSETYASYLKLVEDGIKQFTISYPCENETLFASINYSLYAGGKRLRPIMLLAACEMVGGDVQAALPFAIGLEMIHTSSLIHDDLPAMDNDDLRRGKPTNHKVYGEARAILAGDTLLVRPFEIMAKHASDRRHIQAMEIIAGAAGCEGMMGGQEIDLKWEGKKADEETIMLLNRLKTGALFCAALKAGVVLGGGTEEQVHDAEVYAQNFGLAFQLTDDLLDDDPSAETGKTKGSDIANQKSTYLSLYGSEKCKRMVDTCMQNAENALQKFGSNGVFLVELVQTLKNRRK